MKVTTHESIVHRKLRAISRTIPHMRVQRIENQMVEGMPDMVVLLGGLTYFVEAKMARRRVSSHPAVKVRASQVNWIEDWSKAGGLACVIVATPDGSLHSVGPEFVRRLREEGLRAEFIVRSVRGKLTTQGLHSLLSACQYGAHVQTLRPIKVEVQKEGGVRASASRLERAARTSIVRGASVPFVLGPRSPIANSNSGSHRASFAGRKQ